LVQAGNRWYTTNEYENSLMKNWKTFAYLSDIPTVNNGTLNLQADSTTVTTFTANQSGNSTFNIATGSSNGTISVGGTDVSVKGLGTAAYKAENYFFKEGRDWLAYQCTVNYGQWNRILKVTHGSMAGQAYLISIETHYSGTVCCVTFHITATLSGGVTITEWRAG